MLSLNTKLLLLSFTTLAVIHIMAMQFELYWVVGWFDIPMHFFGGIIVALGLYTIRDISVPVPAALYRLPLFLCAVLAIALVWELFEYMSTTALPVDYVTDTITDVVLGGVGGMLGFFMGKRIALLDI